MFYFFVFPFFVFLLMDSFDFATNSPSSVGNRIILMTDNVEDKKSLTPGNHFLFNLHRQKKRKYLRRLCVMVMKLTQFHFFFKVSDFSKLVKLYRATCSLLGKYEPEWEWWKYNINFVMFDRQTTDWSLQTDCYTAGVKFFTATWQT